MSYTRARLLLIFGGIAILAVVALVMLLRGVDVIEVWATLLFVPIFLGFLYFYTVGGVVMAVAAGVVYLILRLPAIDAVGFGEFSGTMFSRWVAYLFFGLLGGVATQLLKASLVKLDLYDQIDDATGLFNAHFMVEDLELEQARSRRYQTLFSVALIEVPAAPITALGRRRQSRAMKELGRVLEDSIRTVDRAAHSVVEGRHRIAVVLPETPRQGAEVFINRLANRVAEFLTERGAQITESDIAQRVVPSDDEDGIRHLHDEYRRIDRFEHPEREEELAAAARG